MKNQPKKTKPAAKKPLISKQLFTKRNIALVVVAVCLVLYGVGQLRKEIQFRHDKVRYDQNEASMKKVYADIVAAAGTPFESHHGQGCGYLSAKYTRGKLNCSNYYSIFYQVNTQDEGKI